MAKIEDVPRRIERALKISMERFRVKSPLTA
jgi:hypothetical protein